MKQFITPDVLANQVRMQRSAFRGAFIFVEGESDERLYSLFFDQSTSKIIITHGRPHVFAVCEILKSAYFAGFFGVADADFDHADEKSASNASVFLTDWHDGECYPMKTSPFERILHEYADRDKLAAWKSDLSISDVRIHLLQQAAEIGYLLWYSLSHSLGLNFKGLSVEDFVSQKTLLADRTELVKRVLILSSSPLIQAEELVTGMDLKRALNADLWQVARGHDLVHLLCFALRTSWKRENGHLLSSEAMEGVLRTAYPITEFTSTELYQQIRSWESDNFTVLRF